MLADLTVVINIAAGDAAYAYLTVGALAKAHRKSVKEVILILDDTKAQYSDFYDHQKRYQEPDFTENLEKVTAVAKILKQEGLVDTIIPVSFYAEKKLNKKYFKNRVKETHDFRGAPITAYLVGFAACKTQFLVRYDGDVLLHQTKSDWVFQGIDLLKNHADCMAVSPRPSPPVCNQKVDFDFDPQFWFSTRCTLFDLFKFNKTIPFLEGKYFVEVRLRKLFRKTYPPAFETILGERLKKLGFKNYYLLNQGSWLLHPEEKNSLFIKLLPAILPLVEQGNYPKEQADHEILDLNAWKQFLKLN